MTLFSIPELAALPRPSRRRLILAALRSWLFVHMGQLTMICCLGVGCVVLLATALLTSLASNDTATAWGAGVLLASVLVLMLSGLWFNVRSEVRDFARREAPGLFGPTCAACGYDLRGSDADLCPECGAYRVWTSESMNMTMHRKDDRPC